MFHRKSIFDNYFKIIQIWFDKSTDLQLFKSIKLKIKKQISILIPIKHR